MIAVQKGVRGRKGQIAVWLTGWLAGYLLAYLPRLRSVSRSVSQSGLGRVKVKAGYANGGVGRKGRKGRQRCLRFEKMEGRGRDAKGNVASLSPGMSGLVWPGQINRVRLRNHVKGLDV